MYIFNLSISENIMNGLKKAWLPAVILLVIAVIFAVLIVVLSKVLAVPVDEKEESIRENLAGANCGACGYAGCSDFAKALSLGKAELSSCSVTDKEHKQIIAGILGVQSIVEETKVVVKCGGGQLCKDEFEYQGYQDCKSANTLNGGFKSCSAGCIGLSSCTAVCPTGAILVDKNNKLASVSQEKCINCGLCISECPKSVVVKIPKTAKVLVACKNTNKGKDVKSICSVGCIACGICAKNCPEHCITMENNLPVIDYLKCTGCKTCVKKCPCHTIVEI